MKAFLAEKIRRHWPMIVNVVLVVALGRYAVVKAWEAWDAGQFNFVEVAFAAHNLVMLTLILVLISLAVGTSTVSLSATQSPKEDMRSAPRARA